MNTQDTFTPDNEKANAQKAVVLLSGGLDSTTVLAMARAAGYRCHTLSFHYGQRQQAELALAEETSSRLGAEAHLVLRLDLDRIGGSALTGAIDVPKDRPLHDMEGDIPVTYVPARNIIFLAHALAWAEVLDCRHIFLGVNAVDYSGYPDCRPEFIEAFARMAKLGTRTGVNHQGFSIHTPLIRMSKREIIQQGLQLGVDYSRTHTCYDPRDGLACGRCDACRLRRKGFAEAGLTDPLPYVAS